MIIRTALPCLALAAVAFLPTPKTAPAPAPQDDVVIQTIPVAGNVSMLIGEGGNIGVSTGPDGAFLVDDQFAPLTGKILAAVAELTDQPARYLVNTHWHGDHTGGNENMGEQGVVLVAHDNVRARMSVEQFMEAFDRTVPASPEGALPRVTFSDTVTFHWNGDTVHIFHAPNAHTDGDVVVHFTDANVVHMGDTFFRDRFPFIDTATGGSIDGVIAAAGEALALMNPRTMVIPGHGALSTREDLRDYRDALMSMRDAVAGLMEEGHPLEHILDFRPIQDQAEAWGQNEAAERNFVATIHYGLTN
jgi:cyclase